MQGENVPVAVLSGDLGDLLVHGVQNGGSHLRTVDAVADEVDELGDGEHAAVGAGGGPADVRRAVLNGIDGLGSAEEGAAGLIVELQTAVGLFGNGVQQALEPLLAEGGSGVVVDDGEGIDLIVGRGAALVVVVLGSGAAAAGQQRKAHHECQDESESLFHFENSPFRSFLLLLLILSS